MAAKNTTQETAPTATEEIDTTLADVLDEAPEVDPTQATMEQIAANIERARSLAEAENVEGLAALDKETKALISSLPRGGKTPDGKTWAGFKAKAGQDFRQAAAAQPKPDAPKAKAAAKAAELEVKAKADAEAADYSTVDGVTDRVNAGASLIYDGAHGLVRTAQTARQAAEMLLDAQRLIITKDGVPDLKCADPKSIAARKDMYAKAKELLTPEGGEEHADSLVKKFGTSVRNQMSDVLRGYIRELDTEAGREEYEKYYAPVAAAHPDLSPSEAVHEFYEIPKLSKRELMNARNAAKAAKLAELEAKVEEGDETAAEQVQEIKAKSAQDRIVEDITKAEEFIQNAIKSARSLSDDDKAAVKGKIAELALLAAQL
jgi:hypothetical protein